MTAESNIGGRNPPILAPSSPIGTVLLLKPEPLKSRIWDDILRIVPVGSFTDDALNSREVARFLDLLGMLSADKYRFFLDDDFYHEGFERDQVLRDQLIVLADLITDHHGPAAGEIEKTLERLGLHSRTRLLGPE